MANIRIDLAVAIIDGQSVTFRSPIDCSQITGLIVYYPENGVQTSMVFQFADAHGNNVGDIDLFTNDVLVKVVLDTELKRAYVQNADTNAYLEAQLAGKAPSGFGLGEGCKRIDSMKNISKNGWWLSNVETPDGSWWMCHARQTNSGKNVVLDAFNLSGGNKAQRVKNTDWGEWEWVNPPMVPDEEYRTTERWDSKAVYTKLVDLGNSASAMYVPHGANFTTLLRCSGVIGGMPMPIESGSKYAKFNVNTIGIELFIDDSNTYAGQNVKVRLWYVKD